MADIFVSYAWADDEADPQGIGFVSRLVQALETNPTTPKDVWHDKSDLPPAESIPKEFIAGIDEADIFVSVLSKDYLERPNCQKELNHAIAQHKRIIPVLRRDEGFNFDEFNRLTDSLNAIDFRQDDHFDASFARLIETINTDLDYVREHKRLLVRALEWQRSSPDDSKKRDLSLVLRGSELSAAEDWRTLGLKKKENERPTELHLEYLDASRKDETRRALDVEYRLGLAQSSALAAQSRLEISGLYPERAILLGIEALEHYPYTWQAEQALSQAIVDSRGGHERLELSGHTDAVYSASWSPDGKHIVTSSDDGTSKIWDAVTGKEEKTIAAREARWLPDSQYLLTDVDDHGVFWDATTGEKWRTFDGYPLAQSPEGADVITVLEASLMQVWNVSTGEKEFTLPGSRAIWSPDGTQILTDSDENTVIWDAETGKQLFTLPGTRGNWSPDGSRIQAANDEDFTWHIWDAKSQRELSTIPGGFARWSPDSTQIITDGDFGTLKIWDSETGDEKLSLPGHPNDVVYTAIWSPNGTKIVTYADDGKAIVWDAQTGEERFTFAVYSDSIADVSWSPNGSQLIATSEQGKAIILDVQDDVPTLGSGQVFSIAPDSRRIAIIHDNVLSIQDILTASALLDLDLVDTTNDYLMWSADGTKIATSGSKSGTILWDVSTHTKICTLLGENPIWSPDAHYVATGLEDGTTSIWDATTCEQNFTLSGSPAACSPDGAYVATSDDDGTIDLWETQNFTQLHSLTGHKSTVTTTGWSPNGEKILTTSDDGTARIWNAQTGAVIFTLTLPENPSDALKWVYAGSWSPDGKSVVTAHEDGTARVWDSNTGKLVHTLNGHQEPVFSAAWSPNGQKIVTASRDLTIRVWDVASGQQLMVMKDEDMVSEALWLSDGQHIVSSSNAVKVWPAWESTDKLIAYAKECCVVRELTADERTQFGLPPAGG